MKRFLLIIMLLMGPLWADTINIEQAVKIGLENNYNIKIARNNNEKAKNTLKLRAGSLLPVISAQGSIANTETEYGTPGTAIPSSGAGAGANGTAYTVGGSLGWTLFDGFRMFYAFSQVGEQAELSKQAARHDIESGVVNIITAYYNLASSRSLLRAADKQLEISERQMQYIKTQHEYGRAAKRIILRQQVILNTDSAFMAARKLDAARALHSLNTALGRRPEMFIEIAPDTSVDILDNDAAFWYKRARDHNAALKMAEIQSNIAASQLGIARAAFWPVISAYGSYDKSLGDNEYVRTSTGLNLNLPLSAGFSRLTGIQNAKLDMTNAELSIRKKEQELEALIYQQWELFNNASSQVKFERKAVALAEESMKLSEEQYKLSGLSDLQIREVQLSLLNARVRLESAFFQSKVVAVQLKQLAGELKIE
ncbi:MAG: TolC family protein [bacterium]